ncbi:hypothetical protein [Lysobacter gummosus]|uniref:hypothetical protein n=1 Tax=Lysobacter gummosus TaxID=262324 RepID=UPI003628AF1A
MLSTSPARRDCDSAGRYQARAGGGESDHCPTRARGPCIGSNCQPARPSGIPVGSHQGRGHRESAYRAVPGETRCGQESVLHRSEDRRRQCCR